MTETKKKAETKKKKTATTSALEIYVGEDKVTIAQTVKKQVFYLSLPTPEKYIMQRKGRGGLMLDYVETNYVIGRLNAAFMFDWDTEIIEQIVDKENNQIAMKVRLTARFADGKEIKKDAWGGSDIKRTKESKEIIDFADDLKSAESDAIKKAASMIGICWDVYAGLTSSGKKARKTSKEGADNGFTEAPGTPDRKNQFRTIPIKIGKKTYLHTKYEVLDRFKMAKSKLGKEIYYKTLGANGYEKSDQIPPNDIQKLYDAMATAYKEMKLSMAKKEPKKTTPEPEKKPAPPESPEVKEEAVFPDEKEKESEYSSGATATIKEEKPEPEVIEQPVFPGDETENQSLGFSTAEVEEEGAEEFKPATKPPEKVAVEMPLQAEIMSLAGLEAMLVDKHKFKPSQICEKLKEMFGEDELIKLTRKQTKEAIEYFKGVMAELDKAKKK